MNALEGTRRAQHGVWIVGRRRKQSIVGALGRIVIGQMLIEKHRQLEEDLRVHVSVVTRRVRGALQDLCTLATKRFALPMFRRRLER